MYIIPKLSASQLFLLNMCSCIATQNIVHIHLHILLFHYSFFCVAPRMVSKIFKDVIGFG